MKKIYERHLKTCEKPQISFMCPIHNMDFALPSVFGGIVSSYSVPAEVIFVLDSCTDKSEVTLLELIENFLSTSTARPPISFYVFRSKKNLFESKVENFILTSVASAEYVMSIQADIVLEDFAYDRRVIQIFQENPDIFMISGRGTHDWELPEMLPKVADLVFAIICSLRLSLTPDRPGVISQSSSKRIKLTNVAFFNEKYFGRCGANHELEVDRDPKLIYLSETVMRGPLAFKRSVVTSIGGLDWKRHRLGNDDHELALRGWRKLSLRTAYYPASFNSPIGWGTSRRRKTSMEALIYLAMRTSERIYHFRKCLLQANTIEFDNPQKEIRRIREA